MTKVKIYLEKVPKSKCEFLIFWREEIISALIMNIGNGLIEQMDIIYQKKVRQSDNCAHESVPTSYCARTAV